MWEWLKTLHARKQQGFLDVRDYVYPLLRFRDKMKAAGPKNGILMPEASVLVLWERTRHGRLVQVAAKVGDGQDDWYGFTVSWGAYRSSVFRSLFAWGCLDEGDRNEGKQPPEIPDEVWAFERVYVMGTDKAIPLALLDMRDPYNPKRFACECSFDPGSFEEWR